MIRHLPPTPLAFVRLLRARDGWAASVATATEVRLVAAEARTDVVRTVLGALAVPALGEVSHGR
ncbi:MAG: hypothetical protein L0Y64_14985 [Myxococcaceae bacterium]|nr:hypothetical protein [Myxococcaceae bacterium]